MRKLNKLIRNEKGSISMFVILSVLFLTFVLVGIYANYANKLKAQEERIGKIKNSYGQYASDEGMDKLYIKQTNPEQDTEGDIEEDVPLLPAEYQQVEYLESTGTQYIDTGYIPNNNTRVECKYKLSSNDGMIFGSRISSSSTDSFFAYTYTNELWCGYGGQNTMVNISTSLNEVHTLEVSKNGAYFDNKLIKSYTQLEFNGTYSLYLFGLNQGGTLDSRTLEGAIYSFKIYESDILRKNLIPCYRKSDNVVGMYDTINGVFYTNSGTGNFKVDPENKPLPLEYQRVEYIESTGTQYIDTGVTMTENIKLELDFQITQVTDTNKEILTGAWDNNLNGFLFGIRSGYFQYAYAHSEWNGSSVKADCERHKIIVNKNGDAWLDDVVLANVGSNTLNSNTSIYLCNTNIERSWNQGIKTKIFNAKIYNNSNLIRNFIPCYRKSDNVAGMYDTVNSVFYTNSGTGRFLIEDENVNQKLPSEYQQVEYIESTGIQYIDTGVVCNENLKIEVEYKISSFDVDLSYIFGVYGESSSYRVQYSHANVIFAGFGNMYSDNITAPKEDKRYHLIMDNGKFTLDEQVIYDATSAGGKYSSTNNATIALFARNGNGSIGNYGSNKIYSCKMSIGETEIRNLVPCYRKSDNVAGMYDTVNGVFYTNSGTGSFLKGSHADGTTEVEYIQSTGIQYIDTGMKLNQDSNIELEFEVTEAGNYNVFGSRSSATENNIGIIFSNTYKEIDVDFQDYTKNRLITSYDISKKIYSISNEALRAGDTSQSVTSYSDFTTPENAYIFSMSGNSPTYENAKMKFYYGKIWNGDTLTRDYIPVLDKEGVACLYDKVEGKYYYNQGKGTFLYE